MSLVVLTVTLILCFSDKIEIIYFLRKHKILVNYAQVIPLFLYNLVTFQKWHPQTAACSVGHFVQCFLPTQGQPGQK